jgi:hypothetical protein
MRDILARDCLSRALVSRSASHAGPAHFSERVLRLEALVMPPPSARLIVVFWAQTCGQLGPFTYIERCRELPRPQLKYFLFTHASTAIAGSVASPNTYTPRDSREWRLRAERAERESDHDPPFPTAVQAIGNLEIGV